MNTIIVGAGELGHLIASRLCDKRHNVIILDRCADALTDVNDSMDAKTITGSGTSAEDLLKANVQKADLFFAVTSDEASNALACIIAKKLGAKETVCRLYSKEIISKENGLDYGFYNIDHWICSKDELVKQIEKILPSRVLQQTIPFFKDKAQIDIIQVPVGSSLLGRPLKQLDCKERLKQIRLAAIIRNGELIVPNGDTEVLAGDRIYIAGKVNDVDNFTDWMASECAPMGKRVVIAGATPVSEALTKHFLSLGYDVRLIEPNLKKIEELQNRLSPTPDVLHGEFTNPDLLEEADVEDCDVFAALSEKDENNILACLLALRMNAQKVINLTSKAEYMDILPKVQNAGCWFNMTLIAANTIFKLISRDTLHVDTQLQAANAKILTFRISDHSKFIHKPLQDCALPNHCLIAMIYRNEQVIAPIGTVELQPNDEIVIITDSNLENSFKKQL